MKAFTFVLLVIALHLGVASMAASRHLMLTPGFAAPELYKRDPDQCCFINKVKPLQDALEEYDGWISGLRRDQSPLRADTPLVSVR